MFNSQAHSDTRELQNTLFNALPSDVIDIIFSFIDQRDCVTCLSVCREWYNQVPEHTRSSWATVTFSTSYPSDDIPTRHRFLGNHVKAIEFDEYSDAPLHALMKKLIACGCKSVKSVEFTDCSTVDQGTFLRLLKVLAPRLTQLKMTNHQSNVSLPHILSTSTEITSFTFQASSFTYDQYGTYDQEPLVDGLVDEPLENFTSLTVLCLDTIMDKQLRLEPLLKKCPNLRCFVSASSNAYYGASLDRYPSPMYEERAIDLDKLISWCPKITNLAVNSSYHWLHGIESDLEREMTDDTADGICHLRLCHNYSSSQVIPLLIDNQQTLELVSVTNESDESGGFDCSSVFGSLHLPHLHTLIFKYVQIDGPTIVSAINNCPLIHTLAATGAAPIVFDSTIIQKLYPRQTLCHIEFGNIVIEDKSDALEFLGRFQELRKLTINFSSLTLDIRKALIYFNQLKHLHLNEISVIYKDDMNLPFDYTLSQVETIDLYNVKKIGYDFLSLVGPISTLKHLCIPFDDALCANDKNGLNQFTELINGENLETLSLYAVRHVTYTLLDALGSLPNLNTLEIFAPYDIARRSTLTMRSSMRGLLKLLNTSKRLAFLAFDQTMFVEDQKIYTQDEVAEIFAQNVQSYTLDSIAAEEAEDEEGCFEPHTLQCVEINSV